jgi:hypothetical protein
MTQIAAVGHLQVQKLTLKGSKTPIELAQAPPHVRSAQRLQIFTGKLSSAGHPHLHLFHHMSIQQR